MMKRVKQDENQKQRIIEEVEYRGSQRMERLGSLVRPYMTIASNNPS